MARFAVKKRHEIGLSPDALVFRGVKKMQKTRIRVIRYDDETVHESELDSVSDLEQYMDPSGAVTWINIDGIDNEQDISELGRICSLEKSILADIMNPHQRAAVQERDDIIFITLKMLQFDPVKSMVTDEQLSIVMKGSLVITFQEIVGDVFEPVRERIRKHRKIASSTADFLVLSLIDIVIDTYLLILSSLGDQIELLEEDLIENLDKSVIERIYRYKKELNFLRKNIIPTRDMVQRLGRTDSELLGGQYRELMFDLLNNGTQSVEISESFREILSDQLSLYNTQVSNKLNDVMKILTIFSAIFIPLTFIAGIYGTNFEYIPELAFRFSYFIMLGVMVVVASVMLIIFWRKRWFGSR